MKKPVIAIDGFSSTGKSSISKIIAQKLDLIHIDTGALYRGITVYALQNCMTADKQLDTECLIGQLPKINLEFKNENQTLVLYLNDKNIDREIRDPKISSYVSDVAKLPAVREFLLKTQRDLAAKGGVIMDGRDIGTIVLKDADYKFFLTASIEARTERRYLELLSNGLEVNKNEVRENLIKRDKIDSEREVAPLKQADDAILIDNSHLNKEETIDLILSYLK